MKKKSPMNNQKCRVRSEKNTDLLSIISMEIRSKRKSLIEKKKKFALKNRSLPMKSKKTTTMNNLNR